MATRRVPQAKVLARPTLRLALDGSPTLRLWPRRLGNVQEEMVIAQGWPASTSSGNPDDGVRLRSLPVGAIAEAARVSYVHVCFQNGAGRQGILRAGLRFAGETTTRRTWPHLQPDQQSRSRNVGGSSDDLGRSGGQSRLRLGHGGHLDDLVVLCSAGNGSPPFRSGLRRDGFPAQEDTAAIRRYVGRVCGGGRDRGARRRRRTGPGGRPCRSPLYRNAGQSDQWSRRSGGGARDRRQDARSPTGDHRRQHDCSVRSIRPRSPTVRIW